ncbi:MAG: Cyanophage [Bacteroidota bacterium]|jgi:hypothetical protein
MALKKFSSFMKTKRTENVNEKRYYIRGDKVLISDSQTPTNVYGEEGSICWDENFIYVCTSEKNWKAVPLTTLAGDYILNKNLKVNVGNNEGIRVESSNCAYIEVGKTGDIRWRWTNDYDAADQLQLTYGINGADPNVSFMTIKSYSMEIPNLKLSMETGYYKIQSYSSLPLWLNPEGNRIIIGNSETPSSATATGMTGSICWDSNYIYICTATNTWKRVGISTW